MARNGSEIGVLPGVNQMADEPLSLFCTACRAHANLLTPARATAAAENGGYKEIERREAQHRRHRKVDEIRAAKISLPSCARAGAQSSNAISAIAENA
jgi:hypothetical protein